MEGTGLVERVKFQVLICTNVMPCHIVFRYLCDVRYSTAFC